jgi:hypothetical protein
MHCLRFFHVCNYQNVMLLQILYLKAVQSVEDHGPGDQVGTLGSVHKLPRRKREEKN